MSYDVGVYSMECCGVKEVYGVNEGKNVDKFIEGLKKEFVCGRGKCRFLILTEVRHKRYKSVMKPLIKMIENKRWGTITSSVTRCNPNSGNNLRVYIWALSEKASIDLCKTDGPKKASPFTF